MLEDSRKIKLWIWPCLWASALLPEQALGGPITKSEDGSLVSPSLSGTKDLERLLAQQGPHDLAEGHPASGPTFQ